MQMEAEQQHSKTRSFRVEDLFSARWLQQVPIQVGIILAVGLGIYLHTLHAPFILDDIYCITENPAVRDFTHLLDFDRIRGLNIWSDIKNNMALRSVVYWTFALNYLFGGASEFGYHLVNIAIHLINSVLVYLLVRTILRQAPMTFKDDSGPFLAAILPLVVALLFVIHPLQTQAVTYINQRFTSLLTLFYLGALLLYVGARTAATRTVRRGCCVLALLFTVLAMKTQESAFTLPVMLLLYELLFLEGPLRQRLLRLAPFGVTMAIIPGTLFWLTTTSGAGDPRSQVAQSVNLVNFSGISQWDYLVTQFGVIATYLRLLLWPTGQNLIPYYPLATSWVTPKTLGALVLLLLLFGGAVWLVITAIRARERGAGLLIGFGILWFFITISVSSSIIPLEVMLLEYRVYLPSVGAFLAFAVAIAVAVDKGWLSRKVFVGGAVLAVALLCAATVARNHVYNDRIAMMKDILVKNPQATPARVIMVGSLLERERFAEAIDELQPLLQALPNDTNMIVNLGYALTMLGRVEEGMQQYRRALKLNPDSPFAHGHLGVVYLQQGAFGEAESEFLQALAVDPHLGYARYQLAALYESQGRTAEAIAQYRLLLQSYPGDPQIQDKLTMLGTR